MQDIFTKWNNWLSRHMFYVVLSALLFGFILPMPGTLNWKYMAVFLFGYMTFVTSLEITLKDFFHVLSRPLVNIWMLLLIHVAMPLVAWGVGLIFYPENLFVRTGFIIGASIPIGVTSIIWTSIVGGNVAMAMVAVTLDTLVSPLLLPVFIFLVVGQTVSVDYIQLFYGLLWMVTIPSLLGMAVNDLTRGRLNNFSRSFGGFSSKLALFLVILFNANAISREISWDFSLLKLLLVILLLVTCGYSLGYLGSFVLKDRRKKILVTMVYNVGMRNISFGAVLALVYFPAAVAIPVTLAMLYQQPLAAAVSHLFNRYDRRHAYSP